MLALVALVLVPPVPGALERPFSYAGDPFARGLHRGVDLAARPGAPVRAACSGRVTFAGRAVAIRCGRYSVTHLPLRPAVRAGQSVTAGAPIGTVAAAHGHSGLHLGVRRASDRFGYVDPAPLLHEPPRHAPPAPLAAPRRDARRLAPPPPHPAPLPSGPPGRPAPAPARPRPRAAPATPEGSSPVAPWPAWAGLALLLAGAAGAGTAGRRRARRAAPARAAPAQVR